MTHQNYVSALKHNCNVMDKLKVEQILRISSHLFQNRSACPKLFLYLSIDLIQDVHYAAGCKLERLFE